MPEPIAADTLSRGSVNIHATEKTFKRELPYRLGAAACGALLALAAPGLDQWYLVWFGVIPLLVLTVTSKDPWFAGVRGWHFGTAYNLVYTSWYLYVRPEYCDGTFSCNPVLMRTLFWLMMSMWQGLFISIFPCLLRAMPLTGGFLPVKHHGRWYWPTFLVLPALWLLLDKMCNNPLLLGVPWSSLEYTQYQQTAIIQIASVIGGAGLTVCIILCNAMLIGMIGFKNRALQPLSYTSRTSLILNSVVALSLLLCIPLFGVMRLAEDQQNSASKKKLRVCAVQANLSTKIHKVNSVDIMKKYLDLCTQSPRDAIVVWPEWALQADFTREQKTFQIVADIPPYRRQSWIVGAFDSGGKEGQEYNSVCAMDRRNKLLPQIYHKRYLVPFGEFTPDWAKETPIGTILYGPGKVYHDSTADTKTVLFKLSDATIGPMLCFECMLPKLSVDSVRAGAQILCDCSNTSWFYRSIVSDQMVAFCTMRAVENHRPFVFSTVLGPSTIIDSVGRMVQQAPREQAASILAEVTIEEDFTPYTRWSW